MAPAQPARPSSGRGLYAVLGLLIVIAALLAVVIVLLLTGTIGAPGTLVSATSSPGPSQVAVASGGSGSSGAPPSAEPSVGAAGQSPGQPTAGPTAAPTAAPTSAPSPAPTSTKATITAFSTSRHADCHGENGTGQVGYIKLTWSTERTTGVVISFDVPPATAYMLPYDSYASSGSTTVPYTCDLPSHDSGGDYHEYILTTLPTTGYYQYRYIKVYQSPPLPTPTPS